MAHIRPVNEWRPVGFFPWVERRRVGLFLDTAPNVPVDISAFWTQYRWKSDYAALEAEIATLKRAIAGKPGLEHLTHGQYLEMAHMLHAACDGGRTRAETAERLLDAATGRLAEYNADLQTAERQLAEIKQEAAEVVGPVAGISDDTNCNDGKALAYASDGALACGINLPVALIRHARTFLDNLQTKDDPHGND